MTILSSNQQNPAAKTTHNQIKDEAKNKIRHKIKTQ